MKTPPTCVNELVKTSVGKTIQKLSPKPEPTPERKNPGKVEGSGRFVLLYSVKAARHSGYNIARLDTGKEVPYTCMQDEDENGPWEKSYLWEDAKVVGRIDSYSQVIKHGLGCRYDDYVFSDFSLRNHIH